MRPFLFPVVLTAVIASVIGISITSYPSDPLVNETVILNVIGISGPFRYAEWFKGQDANPSNQIITINEFQKITNGSQIFKEASVFPNGSLLIRNAQRSHEGFYTVSVQGDQLLQARMNLTLDDSFEEISYFKAASSLSSALTGASLMLCCQLQ